MVVDPAGLVALFAWGLVIIRFFPGLFELIGTKG